MFRLDNVVKEFKLGKGRILRAVDGVNLEIKKGETLGLVGESGCGKTTLGNAMVRMFPLTEGSIYYNGQDISTLNKKQGFQFCNEVQMIFQDPYASLDPRMTIEGIIAEGLVIHKMGDRKARSRRVHELLELVGLEKDFGNRFAHEFSGGQRQRIGIARALAVNPKFLVCDEPISALDVSIQAQIVNLLKDLQVQLGLTYLFIAHDLHMVRYISDRVAVLYLGSVMELSSSAYIYDDPLHPYTQALLTSIPVADPQIEKAKSRIPLEGDVPSPINRKQDCPFASRCRYVMEICKCEKPELREAKTGHYVACHLYKDGDEPKGVGN